MNKPNDITIWENNRRLELLKTFRGLVVTYFENSEVEGLLAVNPFHRSENDVATEARLQINLKRNEIQTIIAIAGIPLTYSWQPPMSTGNRETYTIDLISNLFSIDRYGFPPNLVLDLLDMPIGVYQDNKRKSYYRTCNPFWWIGRLIKWPSYLLIWLLDTSGFEGEKIGNSLLGRLIRMVIATTATAIMVAYSLLGILDMMDWLEGIKALWIER